MRRDYQNEWNEKHTAEIETGNLPPAGFNAQFRGEEIVGWRGNVADKKSVAMWKRLRRLT